MDVLVHINHGANLLDEVDVENLCTFVMEQLDLRDNTEVSISFVTNDEIASLNEEYRGKIGPTDVLSFECDNIDDEVSSARGIDEPFQLGDIIIAPDVAATHANEIGCTVASEIELLLVHGLLHLCGWDHIEDDEAEAMEARERELLAAWSKR